VPAYRVLTNATIQRLATDRPQSTDELEMIHGIGPTTVEQFGYDLMRLINESDAETNEPTRPDDPRPSPAIPAPTPIETPTVESPPVSIVSPEQKQDAYWTWRMLRDGYPWENVMSIRRKSSEAILEDLLITAKSGHDIDIKWAGDGEMKLHLEQRLKEV